MTTEHVTAAATSALPSSIPTPSGLAVIRPGDTLLLTFDRHLSAMEVDQLKADLTAHVDGSIKVAIVEGVSGCAVYRPEDEQ